MKSDLSKLEPGLLFSLSFPVYETDVRHSQSDWKLSDIHRIPAFTELADRPSLCEVRMGWNMEGIYLQFDSRPEAKPCVFEYLAIWIDTRSSVGIRRGNRFCHGFSFQCGDAKPNSRLKVDAIPMRMATQTPDPIQENAIHGQRIQDANGFRIRIAIEAATLTGYQPGEFRELGFFYWLRTDSHRDQYLNLGPELPVGDDPSLWLRLRLERMPEGQPARKSRSRKPTAK